MKPKKARSFGFPTSPDPVDYECEACEGLDECECLTEEDAYWEKADRDYDSDKND